uniref:Uncharacterized protein n=1 Tax=Terrapene triunguis TaxID=2587831 RepID=A0A674IWD3_9SAUR
LTLWPMLAPSRGFSVDVEVPITFKEAAVGFGQSVVQFGRACLSGLPCLGTPPGMMGLLVGAPLQTGEVNETGKVYKCDPGSKRCQEIPIQSKATLCYGVQWCRLCGEGTWSQVSWVLFQFLGAEWGLVV